MKNSFQKLCSACDVLLKKNSRNLTFNAISSLHVLRGHPEILKDYNFFFRSKSKSIISDFKQYLNIFKKIYIFFKNILKNEKLFFYIKEPKKIDCLIVSHLINAEHLSQKNDFYFGSFQSQLSKYKLSSLITLRNFTNIDLKGLSKLAINKENYKVILSNFFKIKNEIKLIKLFLKEFLRINFIKNNSNDENSFLKVFGSIHFLKSVFSNIRVSDQVNYLINKHEPRYVFITYEGHAWERIVIRRIKENYPKITIVAYQFSIISKYHHAMFRPLAKIYNPDFIFTSGSVTADLFKKNKLINKSRVIIYGSEKNKLKRIKKIINPNTNFLILPEGFFSETKIMLNFTILAAVKFPKLNFFFRFHPLVDKDVFLKTNYYNNFTKNLIITDNKLTDDFKNCQYALYRGSAAIIEAVSQDLIPVFYKLKNEVNFDPLFQFKNKLLKIENVSQIEKLLLNKKSIKKELLKIKKYCSKYFAKPNVKILKQIIN
jgi:hypothetical protein